MRVLKSVTLAILVVILCPCLSAAFELNEIRIYQDPGYGSDRYFELAGEVGEDLSDCQYIVLTGSGSVTSEHRLSGVLEDGFYTATPWDVNSSGDTHVCEGYDVYVAAPYSYPGGLWFPTSGNVTYMVVRTSSLVGTTGVGWGMDLDTDDDGTLDNTPWLEIVDSVTVVHSVESGGNLYSANTVGPEAGGIVPYHVIKCDGVWALGQAEVCSDDTIGAANCQSVPAAVPEVGLAPLTLLGAYPNPFNPQTVISFNVSLPTVVNLRIFDVAGRQVRVLLEGEVMTEGLNEVIWDGRNSSGRSLSSGIFFYSIESGDIRQTGRLVLVK